jgi:hypothetical protein
MRKLLLTAAATIAIAAAGSLTSSRVEAMPLGLPSGAVDQIDMATPVALCFYIDGWNGPGMYQCGFRHRRGYGWHGRRGGPAPRAMHRGGGPRHSGHGPSRGSHHRH